MAVSAPVRNRKASTLFIFITLAIDAIGLGIIIPVLPDVVRRFLSNDATISLVYGYFIALYAVLQFATSPLLGRFSDRYGRRPVLLISLFGAGIDYLFMAWAPTLPLLFLGRIISGVSGASFTVANAYIADISDDSNRSKNFGIIGAGFGLGFILGPAIGGFLGDYGYQYPFLAAAFFNLANFAFGLFVLPESLPPEKRRPFDWRALNPFLSLKSIGRTEGVWMLVLVFFLMNLAGQTHPTIWTLYTNHKFAWGPKEVGLSLALVGILSAVSQGALTGPVVKWLGESRTVVIGVLGEALCFIGYGLAPAPIWFFWILIFGSIFWTAPPALQSMVTKGVPESEQGEFQGALMSLISITSILNPLIMTALFAWASDRASTHYLPGAPYLLGSAILFAGFFLTLYWQRTHSK